MPLDPHQPTRIVNLTPHPIQLFVGDQVVVTWPPEGFARVVDAMHGLPALRTGDGEIPFLEVSSDGTTTGLPDPVQGTVYLVSRLTAMAATARDDVVFPFAEHRDAQGRSDGCQALARWVQGGQDHA